MTTPDQTIWRDRYLELGQQICELAGIDARTVPADAQIKLTNEGVTIEHIDVANPGFRTTEHHPWRMK